MLKLDMTTSDALSKPDTIKINNNVFKKYINETNNSEYTTCLDLALKKVSLNTYITNLGKYNSTGFNNKYTERKFIMTKVYKMTVVVDYSIVKDELVSVYKMLVGNSNNDKK